MHRYGIVGQFFALVILTFWVALGLFPLYWMLVLAFQPNPVTVQFPPNWFPNPFTLGNFRILFRESLLARWVLNSLIVAGEVTLGQLFLSSLAGYAFAKLRFAGREVMFSALLLVMLIPGQLGMIPAYMIITRLGWLDNFAGLIVPALVGPFSIFLMRQFLRTIPTELLESARLDGCGEFAAYWRIVLPLARPALAVLAILTFIGTWNDFMWPLIIMTKAQNWTLQVGLAQSIAWVGVGVAQPAGVVMASALFAALPCLVLFFAFQRYFMEGLTFGALRG